MAEAKDEYKGGDNGWEKLIEEKESRVTEKLVQLGHHLQHSGGDLTIVGNFLKAPGRCVLGLSTAGESSGCGQSPENIIIDNSFS